MNLTSRPGGLTVSMGPKLFLQRAVGFAACLPGAVGLKIERTTGVDSTRKRQGRGQKVSNSQPSLRLILDGLNFYGKK